MYGMWSPGVTNYGVRSDMMIFDDQSIGAQLSATIELQCNLNSMVDMKIYCTGEVDQKNPEKKLKK